MLDGIWASLPSPPEKDSISRVIREPSSSFPHTGWTNYISQERKITGYYLHGPAQYELQDCLCQQLGQCKPVWNKMKHRGPRNMCWNMSCHVIDCLKLRLRVEEHWKRAWFGRLAEQPQCIIICRDREPQQAREHGGTKDGGVEIKWSMAVAYSLLIAWKCEREALMTFHFLFWERFVRENQPGKIKWGKNSSNSIQQKSLETEEVTRLQNHCKSFEYMTHPVLISVLVYVCIHTERIYCVMS